MNLQIENLSISYSSSKPLFENANMVAGSGQLVAVIGRNGTGKSTFLRSMLSLYSHANVSGQILVDGKDSVSMSYKDRADIFSYVATSVVDVAYLMVRDVVAMGRFKTSRWSGSLSAMDDEIVVEALKDVDALQYSDRFMTSLSDGERQRVMIARAIAQKTPIIILDEPTAFLDVPGRNAITSLLCDLAHRNKKLVIYSTHEIELAKKYADVFWLIDGGKISSFNRENLILPSEFN